MEEGFKRKDVQLSIQKFQDYADDVLRSDRVTFGNRLSIFLNHCENDRVMNVIKAQLMAINIDAMKWWTETGQFMGVHMGGKDFSLPIDEEKRDSLLFKICIAIYNNEIDFITFCSTLFAERYVDALVMRFNEAIFRPMIRSLNYKLNDIRDSIVAVERDSIIPTQNLIVYQSITYVGGDIKAKGDVLVGRGGTIDKSG